MENIMDITDNHLKELKVSIGHRIIFKNKVKFYKKEKDEKKGDGRKRLRKTGLRKIKKRKKNKSF